MQRFSSSVGLTLVVFVMSQPLAAQPDTLWTRTYGGAGDQGLFSIDQTAEGGFIMSGVVGFFSDSSDCWLVRTDGQGDTLWTRTYGDPDSSNICQSGQLTFDGGYIMAGLGGMWLIKTNADGDTVWTRRTGGPGGQEPIMVAQTADSGYIITGNIPGQFADVGLIKTDASGVTEWTRTYDAGGDEYGRFVQQTVDSGYIVLGHKLVGGGQTDLWLLKTNADGDTAWTSTFALGVDGEGSVVRQTADSGYAIFGQIFGTLAAPNDTLPRDWLLIKTDNSGTLQWSRTYGGDGDEQSFDMLLTAGSGFLLTGWFAVNDTTVHLWLVKTDALGDTLWTTTVGDTGLKAGLGLVEIAEGEYAVVGITAPSGEGPFDGWLVRFGDPTAQSTTPAVAGVPEAFALYANYPNPFNPSTTIGFDLPEAAEVTLTVYDILGRELARLVSRRLEAGYHRVSWNGKAGDGREAPTGIYITRLVTPNYAQQIKLVLLK